MTIDDYFSSNPSVDDVWQWLQANGWEQHMSDQWACAVAVHLPTKSAIAMQSRTDLMLEAIAEVAGCRAGDVKEAVVEGKSFEELREVS